MEILGKILIFIFSFCLMPQFYYKDEYMGLILSVTLCILIFHDLYVRFNKYIDGYYNYSSDKNMRLYGDDYNGYGSYYGYGGYYGGNYSGNYETNHKRYMPKTKSTYVSNEEIVANKCKVRDLKIEIIEKRMAEIPTVIPTNNTEVKLLPIKEIVKKELEKKEKIFELNTTSTKKINIDEVTKSDNETSSSSKEVIMIINDSEVDRNRKGTYKTIIDVIKSKKYPTSKCCRLLKAIDYIDMGENSITIYVNDRDLDDSDVMPNDEIKNALRRDLHSYNLEINFVNLKCVSVFDYYIENYTPKTI